MVREASDDDAQDDDVSYYFIVVHSEALLPLSEQVRL